MSKKRITQTDILNRITDSFLFQRFKMLAINQFKWNGLPETIPERYIENCLFEEGQILFFEDRLDGFFCLPMGECGGFDVYGEPLKYNATGFNRAFRNIPRERAVRIENNKSRMPTRCAIEYFVQQLFEVVRTRDVNLRTLKAPFIVSCTDDKLLTMKQLFNDIDKNNFVIYGDEAFGMNGAVQVLQTGVKSLLGELTDTYHDILNEALTYMGINNANTDKRERLITSEAESNNQFIDSCAEMFFESRRRAAEEINAKFGLNVSVELRVPRMTGGGAENVENVANDTRNDSAG